MARLHRHEDCDEAANERDLVVVTGSKDVPITFVATDVELAGRRQQKLMRQALHGAVNVDLIPHRDVRGHFARTQDPALARIGDLLTPSLMALGAVGMAEAS